MGLQRVRHNLATETQQQNICDRIMPLHPLIPKNVHVLFLEICEYVTLSGERDSAHGNKYLDMRYSGLCGWAQCNHEHSYRMGAWGSDLQKM